MKNIPKLARVEKKSEFKFLRLTPTDLNRLGELAHRYGIEPRAVARKKSDSTNVELRGHSKMLDLLIAVSKEEAGLEAIDEFVRKNPYF